MGQRVRHRDLISVPLTGQMPSVPHVALEAVVIGACLSLLYVTRGQRLLPRKHPLSQEELVQVFVSGAVFHLFFEYTGLNAWYVKQYKK